MLINPSRCRMPTPARELSGTDSTVAARPCKGLGDCLVVLCSILASSSIGAPSSRIKQDPLAQHISYGNSLCVPSFHESHQSRIHGICTTGLYATLCPAAAFHLIIAFGTITSFGVVAGFCRRLRKRRKLGVNDSRGWMSCTTRLHCHLGDGIQTYTFLGGRIQTCTLACRAVCNSSMS